MRMNRDTRIAVQTAATVNGVITQKAHDLPVFVSGRTGQGYRSIRNGLASAAKKAGVAGVHWHLTRHTAASWMVMGGVPLPIVAETLGHRSIAMVMRYAHLSPEIQHVGIDALEKKFGKGTDWAPITFSGKDGEAKT